MTIFVEEYKKNGELKKIYINEKIDENKSKIIVAKDGTIIKKNKKYLLRLYNGGITNINGDKTYSLNFSETDYDLSSFSTKSVTKSKVQEISTLELYNCIKNFIQEKDFGMDKQFPTLKMKHVISEQLDQSMRNYIKDLFYHFILS